jgi:hypothetical protein
MRNFISENDIKQAILDKLRVKPRTNLLFPHLMSDKLEV